MTADDSDERTMVCQGDGRDNISLARGINLHIMQSCCDGHGPQGKDD